MSYVDAAINRLKDEAERKAATPPTPDAKLTRYDTDYDDHTPSPDGAWVRYADVLDHIATLTAQLAAANADANRYRFLRENRLGLRAVDGNAGLWEQPKVRENLDWYVDAVIDNPEYVTDAARTGAR